MNKQKRVSILDWIIFLMIASSSLIVIRIGGRTAFFGFQILFCVLMILLEKRIVLFPFSIINFIFIELGISAIFTMFSNMRDSYKNAAFFMVILIIPLYFAIAYLYGILCRDRSKITLIVKAIKLMCLIQLCWIPLQYVTYHLTGMDINKTLFVELLGMLDNASFYRDWTYYPSGFSWHSAILAPMFVIAVVFFDNMFMRIFIVVDALLCGNSTAIIGVFVCIMILLVNRTKKSNFALKKKRLIITLLFIGIGFGIIYKFGLLEKSLDSIEYLWVRLFGSERDASTTAHFGYYFDYPKVLQDSSILQILFGYGYGCSGYPFSLMYNRYSGLGNWAVESDIMDILLSRGLIGFIAYYYFLIYICMKGKRLDKRYVAVMVPIMIQGLGYNVQWDYVFMIEIIMYISIKLNINIFQMDEFDIVKKII